MKLLSDKEIPTEIHFIYGGRQSGKTYFEHNKIKKTKEDKKIEKLDLEDDGNTITLFGEKENEWTILDNVDIIVCNKINEIIDKINGEENEN